MSLIVLWFEGNKYVEKWLNKDRKMILSVRPGKTNYASLVLRDEQDILTELDYPERVYIEDIMPRKLDLYKKYISEQTLWLNIKIILDTLLKIAGGFQIFYYQKSNPLVTHLPKMPLNVEDHSCHLFAIINQAINTTAKD